MYEYCSFRTSFLLSLNYAFLTSIPGFRQTLKNLPVALGRNWYLKLSF